MTKVVIGQKIIEETADASSCPFCGSDNVELRSYDMGGGYNTHYILCKDCGSRGPEICMEKAMPIDAVNAWNRRKV